MPGTCAIPVVNKALRDIRQNGKYPKFADFVELVGEKESAICDPVNRSDNIKLVKSGKSAVSHNVVSEQASVPTVPGIAYVMAITFVTENGISVDRCKAVARDIPNLSTLVLLRTLQITLPPLVASLEILSPRVLMAV